MSGTEVARVTQTEVGLAALAIFAAGEGKHNMIFGILHQQHVSRVG
jgi:hypothetical protein